MTITPQELKNALAEVLLEHSIEHDQHERYIVFDSSEEKLLHKKAHDWLDERIKAEAARRAFFMKLFDIIAQWSIPLVLGAAYYFLTGKQPGN